jgi:hypothetical protein
VLSTRCAEAYLPAAAAPAAGSGAVRPEEGPLETDASLRACPALALLPRAVFGLLRSPLLTAIYSHPDARARCAAVASSLDPEALSSLLYPSMTAWLDADTPLLEPPAEGGGANGGGGGRAQLPLSRSSLAAPGAAAILVDCGLAVIVYAPPQPPGAAAPPMPLPPPPRSALRAAIAELREQRVPAPRLVYIRGGVDDALEALEAALLDDGGPLPDSGYQAFLAAINQAAHEALAE